jgi:DNA-binding XRE family transcriptional regulator
MGIPVRKALAKKVKDPAFRKEYEKLGKAFEIARRLVGAHAREGLTQGQVAKKMGTTQSAIARLESGKRMPSIETLENYARATGRELRIRLVRAAC